MPSPSLALIRSPREALVGSRTQLVNHVPKERSSPLGPAFAQVPGKELPKQSAREHIPEPLRPALGPILEQISAFS